MVDVLLLAIALSIDNFSAAFAMGFRRFYASRALTDAFCSAITAVAATGVGFLLGKEAKNFSVCLVCN